MFCINLESIYKISKTDKSSHTIAGKIMYNKRHQRVYYGGGKYAVQKL